MMFHSTLLRISFFVFSIGTLSLFPQDLPSIASPYFDVPHHNRFIDYSINSGRVRIPFVLNQPFTCADLVDSFSRDEATGSGSFFHRWAGLLRADALRYFHPSTDDDNKGHLQLAMNGIYRVQGKKDDSFNQYRIELEGTYASPYFVLAHRTVTDQAFKDDPYFYGDTGEWIYGRSDFSYAVIRIKSVDLFAGRISRNFGMMDEPSLILSNHPYSYDHFGFRYCSSRFRFAFYVSRLNDVVGFNSQAADTSRVLSRRYFSVQRMDVILRKNLVLGLSQVAMYGGPDRTFEALYLNPINFYYVAQRNNRSQMNGIWAVDMYWKPKHNITLFGQFLLDDIIVNNEPNQDDRAVHPDRLGITAKLVITDVLAPGTQWGLTYNRINNWTYMSYRTWENYVFQGKGMGFPKNAFEGIKAAFDYLGRPPFIFTLTTGFERHGDQDLNAVFGDTKESFPIGVVERRAYFDCTLRYIPSNRFHASLMVRYEHFQNKAHVDDIDENGFSALLSLYSNVNWNRPF